MPWAIRGLREGVLTSRWPQRADAYYEGFRGGVAVVPQNGRMPEQALEEVERICPTGAISRVSSVARDEQSSGVRLDRGRCVLCGRCVRARPDVFGWANGSGTARTERDQLVVGGVPDTEENLQMLRGELARRTHALRRSVHIRHVDAGSDGSDEWEVQALLNPVYDVHRLGIFFTASPRHADILLVTGIGATGMAAPLQRTREAMPDPVVVIAAGAGAVTGGVLAGSYTRGGIGAVVNVDVWVPGSPASPFSLLHAILLALGRLPHAKMERQ